LVSASSFCLQISVQHHFGVLGCFAVFCRFRQFSSCSYRWPFRPTGMTWHRPRHDSTGPSIVAAAIDGYSDRPAWLGTGPGTTGLGRAWYDHHSGRAVPAHVLHLQSKHKPTSSFTCQVGPESTSKQSCHAGPEHVNKKKTLPQLQNSPRRQTKIYVTEIK
jgi:hypothetical protein